jgi:hypothetical protein
MGNDLSVGAQSIVTKIYYIRGDKVMLDSDLADLYEVETKQLKRQVRRNESRFPEDFMFELTSEEFQDLRSQFGSSKHGGTRYPPLVFTEQGIAQLSSVLNSERAILVNIHIIRLFTKMRKMLLTSKDLLFKMEELEKKISGQDERISEVFNYLKQFLEKKQTPRVSIGFKQTKKGK